MLRITLKTLKLTDLIYPRMKLPMQLNTSLKGSPVRVLGKAQNRAAVGLVKPKTASQGRLLVFRRVQDRKKLDPYHKKLTVEIICQSEHTVTLESANFYVNLIQL